MTLRHAPNPNPTPRVSHFCHELGLVGVSTHWGDGPIPASVAGSDPPTPLAYYPGRGCVTPMVIVPPSPYDARKICTTTGFHLKRRTAAGYFGTPTLSCGLHLKRGLGRWAS